MEHPAAPVIAALRDINAKLAEFSVYIKDRLASIELPELGDQPLEIQPVSDAETMDKQRALEVGKRVMDHPRLGPAVLIQMLENQFGTKHIAKVNPAHFNHLVDSCEKMIAEADAEVIDPLAE